MSTQWIVENQKAYRVSYQIKKSLFCKKSPFQKVEVVESEEFGRMLFNDDFAMLSERDEFIYHDMITHPAFFIHPKIKSVLIIGGGDGGTAREVLRHSDVERCVMVEIDELVVQACREFIPSCAGSLDDVRLDLKIEDGLKYIKNCDEKFDLILVDSTDPIGPAQPLFGEEFYLDVYNHLNEDGIVISQGENPWSELGMQKKLLSILGKYFPVLGLYNYHNICYPFGTWSFSLASKKYHPLKDFTPEKIKESSLDFKYYNEAIHRGAFALPNFQLKELGDLLKL